jgi:hypothetical protein
MLLDICEKKFKEGKNLNDEVDVEVCICYFFKGKMVV